VVHRPERHYGEQMHAHLILPAATEHPGTCSKTPLYNNRPHMERFKEIAYHELDRAFDLDRAREQPEPEIQDPEIQDEDLTHVVDEREIEFIRFFEPPPEEDPGQGGAA